MRNMEKAYRNYTAPLFRYLYGLCRSEAPAEELQTVAPVRGAFPPITDGF